MSCDHTMMQSCDGCRPRHACRAFERVDPIEVVPSVKERRDSEAATFRAIAPVVEPARPPIERYMRCSVEIPGGSVEVGLSYETTPDVDREDLRRVVLDECAAIDHEESSATVEQLADVLTLLLECEFSSRWPNRAWFVEVWNDSEALTQVYQPYGMPRHK